MTYEQHTPITWVKMNTILSSEKIITHLHTHKKYISTVIYIHLLWLFLFLRHTKNFVIKRYRVIISCVNISKYTSHTHTRIHMRCIRQWVNVYLVQLNLQNIRCSVVLYTVYEYSDDDECSNLMNLSRTLTYTDDSQSTHTHIHTNAHKYLYIVIEQLCAIRNIKVCTYDVSSKPSQSKPNEVSKQSISIKL